MRWDLSKAGVFIQLAALLLAGNTSAVQVVGAESAEMAWEPASGPVDCYGVFISRDGEEFPAAAEQFVTQPRATVEGAFGQVLVVRVAAFDASGIRGPTSPNSEPIEFLAPPEPDPGTGGGSDSPPEPDPIPGVAEGELLYFEDFQLYSGREDPEGWVDTVAGNPYSVDPALFETFDFADGNVAFGTSSADPDVDSHYLDQDSALWDSYEFSGRMRLDNEQGGVGVTLYSRYPDLGAYYRLGRSGDSAFQISAHGAGGVACAGVTDTGVVPRSGAWYWFRFQAFAVSSGTRLRVRVWDEADEEPGGWQADCVDDRALAFAAGSPGVWSMGDGDKFWDDLEVRRMASSPDPGVADEPEPYLGEVLLAEDFEAYSPFAHPPEWIDFEGGGSEIPGPDFFRIFRLAFLRSMLYASISGGTDVHSYFAEAEDASWASYEFSGSMWNPGGGGFGVTLYGDYSGSGGDYRLSSVDGSSFEVTKHGSYPGTCVGETDTGVVPEARVSYAFRFQAYPAVSGTHLRAKVWTDGSPEPDAWQADCVDSDAGAFESGSPGLWSTRSRVVFWDDLEVRALEP